MYRCQNRYKLKQNSNVKLQIKFLHSLKKRGTNIRLAVYIKKGFKIEDLLPFTPPPYQFLISALTEATYELFRK